MVTEKEIITYQRNVLSNSTLESDLSFLEKIGMQLQLIDRRKINNSSFIYAVESFFNDLNRKILTQKDYEISKKQRQKFISLRGKALALSQMKDDEKLYDNFFTEIASFGEKIVEFAQTISSVALPIVIATKTLDVFLN